MFTPPAQIKWLLLGFAVLAPLGALFDTFGSPNREPVEWSVVVAIPCLCIVFAFMLAPRLRFPDVEHGLTQRLVFTIFAASFVLVGLIGLVRLRIDGLLFWHDKLIEYGFALLGGLSLLCALTINKRLTTQRNRR